MRIARSVLLAGVLAGCVALPPEPSGPLATASSVAPDVATPSAIGSTSSPSTAPNTPGTAAPPTPTAPPVAADGCHLAAQPGAADVAPTKGDLTDWSHIFGGRMRLCLDGARPVELEGTAWCTWADRFEAVTEVALLPTTVDAETGRIDGGVSVDRNVTYLGLIRPGGEIRSWEGARPDQRIRTADRGKTGSAVFDVRPTIDPEHPPAVVPPNQVGTMSWACLDPTPR